MKSFALILVYAMLLADTSFAQGPSCDYNVEVIVSSEYFQQEDFKWRMKAAKIEGKFTNITGKAEIEDSNGKIVKSYKPWTSEPISKQKTSSEYSPNLKPGEYEIIAEISVECNDINKDNNVDRRKIKIRNETEEIKPNQERNGDKEQEIKVEIKDTNTINQTNNQEQFQSSENTTSILTADSKKQHQDEKADNEIQLRGQESQKQKLTAHAVQNSSIVYKSSNEKAKGLIIVFLLILSVLLNIVLIWKR